MFVAFGKTACTLAMQDQYSSRMVAISWRPRLQHVHAPVHQSHRDGKGELRLPIENAVDADLQFVPHNCLEYEK